MSKLKIALIIFLTAFIIRIITLGGMGRTWDEVAYVRQGYHYVELARKFNFSDPFWYELSDHPPLIRYVYGLVSTLNYIGYDDTGFPQFDYNYFFPRLISIILGSLSAVLVFLFGFKHFSKYIGITSGLIFALIPFFVGLSQLATLESFIMLFFTAGVYFFIDTLYEPSRKNIILTGVFTGLAFLTKQSNIILIPLLMLLSFVFIKYINKKLKIKKAGKILVLVLVISLLTIFILWPMPFFHITNFINVQKTMWVDGVKLPPPELFFGKVVLVPFFYYVVMFAITTPLLLLILSIFGIKVSLQKKGVFLIVLAWFLFPFLQSFYTFRQHGVRYIIQLYAPFAILCGIGLDNINYFLKKYEKIKIINLGIVTIYLLISLKTVTPYYLDYFNELVGGTKTVYDHRLFQLGWWGEGVGPATEYISRLENKKVNVAIDGYQPMYVMPTKKNITPILFDKNRTSDYVIVPYFNIVRLGFDENFVKAHYKFIHAIYVDGAPFVKIYKKL